MASHSENSPPDLTIAINLTSSDMMKVDFAVKGYLKWVYAFLFFFAAPSLLHSILQRPHVAGILALAAIVLVPIAGFYCTKRNFDRLPAHQKSARFTFCDEHIESVDEKTSSIIQWSAIIRAVESKTHFFLLINDLVTFVIPKRGMDPQQISILQEWIRYKAIPQKALSKLRAAMPTLILWVVLVIVFIVLYNWVGIE